MTMQFVGYPHLRMQFVTSLSGPITYSIHCTICTAAYYANFEFAAKCVDYLINKQKIVLASNNTNIINKINNKLNYWQATREPTGYQCWSPMINT